VSTVTRLKALLGRKPSAAEDLDAEQDARRIAYERGSIRASRRGAASENYQSGRGSRP
jgi:hypothetical protein